MPVAPRFVKEILCFFKQYLVTSLGKSSPVILLGRAVHNPCALQENAGLGARQPGIHLNSITGSQELVWCKMTNSWQDVSNENDNSEIPGRNREDWVFAAIQEALQAAVGICLYQWG